MGKILRLDEVDTHDAVAEAVAALQDGELVIVPTDTVYGLAGNVSRETAVRIFELKTRQYSKPLPLLMRSFEQLQQVARDVPPAVSSLAERYWPGPVTLIVHKTDCLPPDISAGRDTVGVRVPDHPIALAVLGQHGSPLVVTSANPSGAPPAVSVDDVEPNLLARVAVVLDAGPCPVQRASTVLDMTVIPPAILRPGPITQADLCGALRTDVRNAYNEQDTAD